LAVAPRFEQLVRRARLHVLRGGSQGALPVALLELGLVPGSP
jgi:hypothetical protein